MFADAACTKIDGGLARNPIVAPVNSCAPGFGNTSIKVDQLWPGRNATVNVCSRDGGCDLDGDCDGDVAELGKCNRGDPSGSTNGTTHTSWMTVCKAGPAPPPPPPGVSACTVTFYTDGACTHIGGAPPGLVRNPFVTPLDTCVLFMRRGTPSTSQSIRVERVTGSNVTTNLCPSTSACLGGCTARTTPFDKCEPINGGRGGYVAGCK